jgi:hypothetical protein
MLASWLAPAFYNRDSASKQAAPLVSRSSVSIESQSLPPVDSHYSLHLTDVMAAYPKRVIKRFILGLGKIAQARRLVDETFIQRSSLHRYCGILGIEFDIT